MHIIKMKIDTFSNKLQVSKRLIQIIQFCERETFFLPQMKHLGFWTELLS